MGLNIRTGIVYLVDAEFAIRDSLTLLLESTGLQVKSFDSVEAFLYNFDRTKPTCLILDVKMPFIGGLELKKELSKKKLISPSSLSAVMSIFPIRSKHSDAVR